MKQRRKYCSAKVIHRHPQPLHKAIRQLRKRGVGFLSMQSINAPSALRENGWKYLQPGELPERVWETEPCESSSIGSPDASFAERYVMGCPELLEFGGQSKIPAWKWALSSTLDHGSKPSSRRCGRTDRKWIVAVRPAYRF